jgi:hypothetical protein
VVFETATPMLELAEHVFAKPPFSASGGGPITHVDDGQAVLKLGMDHHHHHHRQQGGGDALTPGPSSQRTHIFTRAETATKLAPVIPADAVGKNALMAEGDVIGRGRDAEILDAGPGLVLRKLLKPRPSGQEAEVMRWVVNHGYPAPRVVEETEEGMVMQRVDGPTMLDRLSARDVRRNMRTLAELHAQLHALPVLPGLPTPYGDGPALLHGDLHPGNVILSEDGPVVIDWTNACAGPAGADLATAWLLIACAGLPETRTRRTLQQVGRRMALAALLSAAKPLGELDLAQPQLAAVLTQRQHDPNMSPEELARMARVVRRAGRVEMQRR